MGKNLRGWKRLSKFSKELRGWRIRIGFVEEGDVFRNVSRVWGRL